MLTPVLQAHAARRSRRRLQDVPCQDQVLRGPDQETACQVQVLGWRQAPSGTACPQGVVVSPGFLVPGITLDSLQCVNVYLKYKCACDHECVCICDNEQLRL